MWNWIKSNWRSRLGHGLKVGFIAAMVGLIVDGIVPLNDFFTGLSYDVPFLMGGPAHADEAVIVSMDDESSKLLDQRPEKIWSRELHARLLSRLLSSDSKQVVFDVHFLPDPEADPREDRRLADAMSQAAGRIILGGTIYLDWWAGVRVQSNRPPVEPFSSVAAWGDAWLPAGRDGRRRGHWYDQYERLRFGAPLGLAWVAATNVGVVIPRADQAHGLNFYGPHGAHGALQHVSYHDVISSNVPPEVFRGKTVFVGLAGSERLTTRGANSSDEYETSISRWTGRRAFGIELQATAFLNLLRKEWLIRLSPIVSRCLYVIFGLALGCLLVGNSPSKIITLALGTLVLLVLSVMAMWWFAHLWFPWLILGLVQTPVALLLAHGQAVKAASGQATPEPFRSERVKLDPQTILPPSIPDHKLVKRIGKGGFGEVWLGQNLTGSFHAVKVIHQTTLNGSRELFDREFRGIQRYFPLSRRHPGWVDVLHVGKSEDSQYFFYIMELGDDAEEGPIVVPDQYRARTLASDLRRVHKLPIHVCLQLGIDLADALAFLHEQGLIHRDIKPANVIFVNGSPKFADIGLVTQIRTPDFEVSMVGTPGYLPPEGPGTTVGDVFSLGRVMEELAFGRGHQAQGSGPGQAESSPSEVALRRCLGKACSHLPEDRFASATTFRDELAAIRAQFVSPPDAPTQ